MISLYLLKNIERLKKSGKVDIKQKWLNPQILIVDIPGQAGQTGPLSDLIMHPKLTPREVRTIESAGG
jgi:hypothetical protein